LGTECVRPQIGRGGGFMSIERKLLDLANKPYDIKEILTRVIDDVIEPANTRLHIIKALEMIGLIPEIVLIQAAEYYMRIHGFDHADLLERNIQSHIDERFTLSEKP
jgi:glutamate formiminotransferase